MTEYSGMVSADRLTKPSHYEVRIDGLLDDRWSAWFEGLTVTSDESGCQTIIAGPIVDQAALHGVLAKIRDLGLPLLSVCRIDPER
jgi:hypothetical protein